MKIQNVVKVMNFHSLLRVNKARKRVENAKVYEETLSKIIVSIISNRNFSKEQKNLNFIETNKELNIYIGSDLGFCAAFNSDVIKNIKLDDDKNDKILIGKKIYIDVPNIVMKIGKEDYFNSYNNLFIFVLNGLLNQDYSRINLIYSHYYNFNEQRIVKKQILPFDFSSLSYDGIGENTDDYYIEGDINYILWNLVAIYVTSEIEIAEALSWASENVGRQKFTNESLKKIDEQEEKKARIERKEKKAKVTKEIVELNNRKRANNLEGK